MISKGNLQFLLPIFYSWVIVLIVRMIPLGGSWKSIDGLTWLVIFIWLAFYFTAMVIGTLQKNKPAQLTQKNNYNQKLII